MTGRRWIPVVVAVALVGGGGAVRAEDPPQTIGAFYRAFTAAYQTGDYPAFLEYVQGALKLRPEHPRLMYNLACGYALVGDDEAALEWLERLAAAGLVYPAEADSDLVSLWEEPRFRSVVGSFAHNAEPVGTCRAVLTLPESGLILESVALDPATGRLFLSSVRERKILVARGDSVADFSRPQDGLLGVFGLKIDAPRHLLWACTGAVPQMRGFTEDLEGTTALVAYDLNTGALVHRLDVRQDGQPHLLGDLVVAPDGSLWATDSYGPRLYRAPASLDSVGVFAELKGFVSPQGLCFAPDGTLFVADYLNGVLALDPATGVQTPLTHPRDVSVFGIDGLYAYRGDLIAVQNGLQPRRVVRLHREGTALTGCTVVAAGCPGFGEPTLGTVTGDDFIFVGDSQWGAYDDEGNPVPGSPDPHVVLRTSLSGRH